MSQRDHLESNVSEILKISNQTVPVRMLTPSATAGGNEPLYDVDKYSVVDLLEMFYSNPNDAFILRIRGDSMVAAGILDGDYLSVDCERPVTNRDIVVAVLNGEVVVKRFVCEGGITSLASENHTYRVREIYPDDSFQTIAVITGVHRKLF